MMAEQDSKKTSSTENPTVSSKETPKETPKETTSSPAASAGGGGAAGGGGVGGRGSYSGGRGGCPFSAPDAPKIDYKDIRLLQRFLSEQGKIMPASMTNVSRKNQRILVKAIKRARFLALLPLHCGVGCDEN